MSDSISEWKSEAAKEYLSNRDGIPFVEITRAITNLLHLADKTNNGQYAVIQAAIDNYKQDINNQ